VREGIAGSGERKWQGARGGRYEAAAPAPPLPYFPKEIATKLGR
jgi:hypothetical protein